MRTADERHATQARQLAAAQAAIDTATTDAARAAATRDLAALEAAILDFEAWASRPGRTYFILAGPAAETYGLWSSIYTADATRFLAKHRHLNPDDRIRLFDQWREIPARAVAALDIETGEIRGIPNECIDNAIHAGFSRVFGGAYRNDTDDGPEFAAEGWDDYYRYNYRAIAVFDNFPTAYAATDADADAEVCKALEAAGAVEWPDD